MTGRETLATILPLEGAVVGVGTASVAVVVVSTATAGSVATVVVGGGRVAKQVLTSVAVVFSLGQQLAKMASVFV